MFHNKWVGYLCGVSNTFTSLIWFIDMYIKTRHSGAVVFLEFINQIAVKYLTCDTRVIKYKGLVTEFKSKTNTETFRPFIFNLSQSLIFYIEYS